MKTGGRVRGTPNRATVQKRLEIARQLDDARNQFWSQYSANAARFCGAYRARRAWRGRGARLRARGLPELAEPNKRMGDSRWLIPRTVG